MSDTNSAPEYILKLSAKDQPGVIAGVAGALAGKGCNIKEELDLFAFGYDAEKRQYTKVLKVMTRYNIQAKVLDIRYKLQTISSTRLVGKAEADSLISTLTPNDSK